MQAYLGQLPVGSTSRVAAVEGDRGFRRRLMEMGLIPGTDVRVLRVAPLGDPIELEVRGSRLSIRREQAQAIAVEVLDAAEREVA